MAVASSLLPLEDRLQAYQKSFDALVQMIPEKYYLPADSDTSLMYKKRNKNSKQAIKESTKKAKKLKFELEKDPIAAATTDDSPDAFPLHPQTAIQPLPPPVGISELRERVKEKIAALRTKRGASSTDTPSSDGPKSRQEILEKRLKRKKEKLEERKKQKDILVTKKDPLLGAFAARSSSSAPAAPAKPKVVVEDLSFGRIEFGQEESHPTGKKKSDPFSLLKKVEAQHARLEQLKERDPEKALAITEKQKWGKVLKLAEGEKIKDELKTLQKTVKRKRRMKENSAKEWADRKANLARTMDDRQKRRNENLKARVEGKLKGKGGGVKKKSRPGFEGGARKKGK
ncbi:surfeit locus protein 6-domain-containing protein [Zopfochytrium polystomum]|nr:surfeit locus protein 6-domain-containing protein [Zopfochytrium polystomum]